MLILKNQFLREVGPFPRACHIYVTLLANGKQVQSSAIQSADLIIFMFSFINPLPLSNVTLEVYSLGSGPSLWCTIASYFDHLTHELYGWDECLECMANSIR